MYNSADVDVTVFADGYGTNSTEFFSRFDFFRAVRYAEQQNPVHFDLVVIVILATDVDSAYRFVVTVKRLAADRPRTGRSVGPFGARVHPARSVRGAYRAPKVHSDLRTITGEPAGNPWLCAITC